MAGNPNPVMRSKNRSNGVLRPLLIKSFYFIVALGLVVGFVFLFRRDSSNKTGRKNKELMKPDKMLSNNRQLQLASEVYTASSFHDDKAGVTKRGNATKKTNVGNSAPIWAVTDEFRTFSEDTDHQYNSLADISVIRGETLSVQTRDYIVACGVFYSSGFSGKCQSLNTSTGSIIPQFGESLSFSEYYLKTSAIPEVSRFMIAFTGDLKAIQQIETDTTYYLPKVTIDTTNNNHGMLLFTNNLGQKNYVETIWMKGSALNHARIDPYDNSISGKYQIPLPDLAAYDTFGCNSFSNGTYGCIYNIYAPPESKVFARFFLKDDSPVGGENQVSSDIVHVFSKQFLLRVGDFAVACWVEKQSFPPYYDGLSMQILDPTTNTKIGSIVAGFPEETSSIVSNCAALSSENGRFFVACRVASNKNFYLKEFFIDNKEITEVANSKLQLNQNPVADNANAILMVVLAQMSYGQILAGYRRNSPDNKMVGRIFATKAFTPEWSDPGFELQITRGECSELKYDCSTADSCMQATLVAGDARTIEAEINGAPHLQFKKDGQAVSTFSIGDEQDNKITVCHDGSAIGTNPTISANVTLSWYSTIDGKVVYSDPKLAAMTVTNQAPEIVIPAHALDVEQGGTPLEKELNQFYSDFDGDALAKVEVTDSTGGVPSVWMSAYENNNLWYVKLAPGYGVTTGDKNFILIFTDARGAITSHTTVANVYKPSNAESDSPDGGIKLATLFPILGSVLSFLFGGLLFTLSVRLCIASGLFGVGTSAVKSANDRRRVRKKSKDNHRLVMAILESTGPIEWGFANLDSGVGQTVSNYLEELLDEKYGENFSEKATLANIKKVKQEISPVIKKIRAKRFSKLYWLIGAVLSSLTCGCVGTGIVVVIQGFDAFLEKYDDEIRKGVGLPPRYADVEMQNRAESELSEPLLRESEIEEAVVQVVTERDGEVASVGDDDIGGGLLDDAPTSLGDLEGKSDAKILAAGTGFFGGGSQDGSVTSDVVLDMSSIAKSSSTESASAPLIRRGSY